MNLKPIILAAALSALAIPVAAQGVPKNLMFPFEPKLEDTKRSCQPSERYAVLLELSGLKPVLIGQNLDGSKLFIWQEPRIGRYVIFSVKEEDNHLMACIITEGVALQQPVQPKEDDKK